MAARAGLLSMTLTAALAIAACGDDDDVADGGSVGDGGPGVSSGTGSDEDYVSSLCKSFGGLVKDFEKLSADPKFIEAVVSNPEKMGEKLAEPYEKLANSFAKAKPPKDLQDWHRTTAKSLSDTAKTLKDGGSLEDIPDSDSAFPDMPAGPEERLSKVAEKNKDCQEAELDFTD